MQQDRISKLLRSEYQELVTNESLLLESPFAETTSDGRGLREVALGLTASRLIVAGDRLDNELFWCEKQVDPSIESLELKSILPLEYVTLKIFRERKRKALEARLIDGRKKYYELGGLGCRSRSWNDWCCHVRRLLRDSETNNARGRRCDGWTRKYLYLGPEYEELWDRHYRPKPVVFARASLETIENDLISPRPIKLPAASHREKSSRRVPRFAEGVNENCSHGLYIPVPRSSSSSSSLATIQHHNVSPTPHFLRGFGPWSTRLGDRVSLRTRPTQSHADTRRRESELRLPISRRRSARATASLASLKPRLSTTSVVLFWTTDHRHRPRDAAEIDRGERREQCATQHRVALRDISSGSLSEQLTLIERDLFARISINEVRNLARRRESRDAPNFAAWVAFARRVACLLESEVLGIGRIDERARIVARLIRTAARCVDHGNFQSASSIVAALQSPAIFRLKATWSYLKEHHSTKYKAMAKLNKLFANTNSRTYREAWMEIEKSRCSSIPSVVDVLEGILGLKDVGRKVDGDLRILGIRFGWQKLREPRVDGIDRFAAWLESCQCRALNYKYPGDSVAREFLLKTRYRESRDNFLSSFNIEPQ